jgi:beta-lactamase class A
MGCNLVEQKISGDPRHLPVKVGHGTNPLTLMEEIRVRQLPPRQPVGNRFPATERLHALAVTGFVLCSTLLLASIVRIIDVRSTNTSAFSAKVPDAIAMLGEARQTTPARLDFSRATSDPPPVSPLFGAYYASHAGTVFLGTPVTPAYRISQGVVQFFMSGALLLPGGRRETSPGESAIQGDFTDFGDLDQAAFADGVSDSSTGIVRLPLLYALLLDGSTLPIDGAGSSLTYAGLRNAVETKTLVPEPSERRQQRKGVPREPIADGGVFITEGSSGSLPVGHTILSNIWSYITRPDISLQGWKTDFGIPLSEARSFAVSQGSSTTHPQIQVFAHAALVVREGSIQPLDTGLAFLETLGAPTPLVGSTLNVWGTSAWADTPVLAMPATGTAVLQIGLNYRLTLDGDFRWIQGVLWYKVRWKDGPALGEGWISADETTIVAPGAGSPVWSSFAPFSSQLTHYLAGQGSRVSAVVYDLTGDRYYLFNVPKLFYMASSVKVPIMLALFSQLEQQHREPNAGEMSLLTTMIENSDNDSAQALFDEIGGAPGLDNFMHAVNIANFSAFQHAWGYSTVSPLAMVRLLALLHDGTILTAEDRGLALGLMENIESDEQVGVGDTVPSGTTIAMKDGWVVAPDELWVMNTSGIVTRGHETYVISVYTQEDSSLEEGWQIAETVCSLAAEKLLAG